MTEFDAWWEREEHRQFGREPTADDLLDRHASRTGDPDAVRTDPFASVTLRILRDFLRLLQAALDDEHVEPGTARRVVERVMYGGVPRPSDVAYRAEQQQAFTNYMATDTRPLRIDLPPEPMCDTCSRIAGRRSTRAVARWWTHGGGYFNDLCRSCLAHWMRNAADDPQMMPHRLERL